MGKQSKRNKETIVSDETKQDDKPTAEQQQSVEPTTEAAGGADSASESGSDATNGAANQSGGESSDEDSDAANAQPASIEPEGNAGQAPVTSDADAPVGGGDELPVGASNEDVAAAAAASLAPAPELAAAAPETPVVAEAEAAPAVNTPLIPKPVTDHADAIVNYIREYVDKMNPAKYMDQRTAVPLQKRLYTNLVELTKLDFIQFKSGMDQLLSLIFEYRHAAFSDLYSRRFFENLYPSMTHAQVREFDEMLHILVTVGSQSNRSRALKQIDLTAALKSISNAKAQQNMSAYFTALR